MKDGERTQKERAVSQVVTVGRGSMATPDAAEGVLPLLVMSGKGRNIKENKKHRVLVLETCSSPLEGCIDDPFSYTLEDNWKVTANPSLTSFVNGGC